MDANFMIDNLGGRIIFLVISVMLPFLISGCVMGRMIGDVMYESVTGDYYKYDRDSGVIGEKKTLSPLKIYHEETTGSTFRTPAKGNFATPLVTGNVAKFKLGSKSFEFDCLGWKYRVQKYWSNPDATAEKITPWIKLQSPDKKTLIYVSLVDVPVQPPLNTHSLTPEQEQIMQKTREHPFIGGGSRILTQKEIQEQIMQKKRVIEDPFVGEESRIIAQQAVESYLNQNLSDFSVSEKDKPIRFTNEHISGKEFVKVEFDVRDQKGNFLGKSLVWAFNDRGFWSADDGKRHAHTWVCQIIADPSEYSSAVAKARQIPETVRFNDFQ